VYENKIKKPRRDKFLGEMDQVISWEELLQVISRIIPGLAMAGSDAVVKDVTDILYAAMVWTFRFGDGRLAI